jgi:hypothetical protein
MHTSISGTFSAAKYLDTLWRGSEGADGDTVWSAMAVRSAHFQGVWKSFEQSFVKICAAVTPVSPSALRRRLTLVTYG